MNLQTDRQIYRMTDRQTDRHTRGEKKRQRQKNRETLIKVIFLKVYLGDSNRQPQPREGLVRNVQ